MKARGIAKDLFGTEKNYVFPVQKINNEIDLIEPLKFLLENQESIKLQLNNIMPKYINRAKDAIDILKKVK